MCILDADGARRNFPRSPLMATDIDGRFPCECFMRFFAAIIVAACALAAGCTSLTSRNRDRDRNDRSMNDRRDPDRPWWQENSDTAGRGKTKPLPADVARTDRGGIIAGVIVDAREGRPLKGITYVHLRAAEELAPASGKGLGFETDAEGYFFVPGLTPGKTYILSVVREVDGRKIAGEAQIKPPAGNIRLELDENKVSSVTPPLPPPPGMGPFERGADRSPPVPNIEPPPSLRKENIAGMPHLPPTAAIRPPPASVPEGPTRKSEEDAPGPQAGVQRVPNFTVSDVAGSDWEFRYASGRLILMEFWSTTCVPCQRAVPAMKKLQGDYGASGLEVVAVACEADASFNSRARDVDEVARRKELNYRPYLERDGRVGEIQKLFNVQYVPLLVLLDRQGTVLWRGGATDADMARVDEVIKVYLTKR